MIHTCKENLNTPERFKIVVMVPQNSAWFYCGSSYTAINYCPFCAEQLVKIEKDKE